MPSDREAAAPVAVGRSGGSRRPTISSGRSYRFGVQRSGGLGEAAQDQERGALSGTVTKNCYVTIGRSLHLSGPVATSVKEGGVRALPAPEAVFMNMNEMKRTLCKHGTTCEHTQRVTARGHCYLPSKSALLL